MADIFDQIDVFDTAAAPEKGDIFDQISPEPERLSTGGGLAEFGKGIIKGTLGVGKGFVGTTTAMAGALPTEKEMYELYGFAADRPLAETKARPFVRAKQKITEVQERFPVTHRGASAWAGRVIGEAIPYMGMALAGGYLIGLPGAAMVGFAVEGDNAYDEAIATGASEEQAQTERVVVGSINAAIEALQIGRLMKFHRTGKHSVRAFINAAKKKSLKEMARTGKQFSSELLKISIEEGLEEFSQEGVSIGVPAVLRDEYPRKVDDTPDWWAIGERLGEASLGGMVAGGVLGGAGAVIADVAAPAAVEPTIEVTEPVVEEPTAPDEVTMPEQVLHLDWKKGEKFYAAHNLDEKFWDWYNSVGKVEARKQGVAVTKNWQGDYYAHTTRIAVKPTVKKADPLTKLSRLQEQADQTVIRGEKPSQGLLDEIRKTKKEVKRETKPTKEQYAAGHKIPEMLGMSEKKRKDFMRKTVGKRSMAKMTPLEAEEYIDALYKLARKKGISVGILPGERAFKEPTIVSKLTPQLYEAEVLGVKFMVDPAIIGKQKLDVEFSAISRKLGRMEKIINKLGKETTASKAKAKLLNKPTKSIKRFTELLNKYEEPPANLSKDEKEIFNYFRTLSNAIWIRENKVREELGMEPILYKKGYVRHIVDTLAQDIIDGRHPIPEEIKYWAEKHVKAKITNPMEFQRKLGDELQEMFSDDLIKITRAMTWTGLKEIQLDKPLEFFKNQLGLHSEVIPASTRRWTEAFVNTMIKGQQTHGDKKLNSLVTKTGVGGLVDKVLKPFGRKVSDKPLTNILQKAGRLQIYGVMGWRPKQLIRNKFQLLQNLALYTTKANLKSYLPAGKQLKKLLSESLFLKTYKGFEDLTDIDKRVLGKFWLAPFQWTAVSNARQAMGAGYYDMLDLIENPKYKGLRGWADPKRTYKEEPEFLYSSEIKALENEMPFGASATQYHYIPMAMPEVFRSKRNIPLTRLQSWWMNYFFNFHREALHRLLKGETRHGRELPWSRRIGWFRYLVIGGLVLNTLGYTKSFLLGAAPESTPPIFQLLLSLYKYIITDNDKVRASSKRKFINALKTFIPGHLAYKDAHAIWTGKSKLHEYFFYAKGIFAKEKKGEQRKGF